MILGFSTISLLTLLLIFMIWISVFLLVVYGIICLVLHPVKSFAQRIKDIIDFV